MFTMNRTNCLGIQFEPHGVPEYWYDIKKVYKKNKIFKMIVIKRNNLNLWNARIADLPKWNNVWNVDNGKKVNVRNDCKAFSVK